MEGIKRTRPQRWLVPAVALILSLILAPAQAIAAPSAAPGSLSQAPVLEDTFAVSSLWGGQVWLIYVQGYDPNGDMRYIWLEVTQLGGRNATEIVYLKGENRGSFSGYVAVYLPSRVYGWETVRAEIRLKDSAGNYSQERVHEAQVGAPTREAVPAKWRDARRNWLGNIFFDFENQRSDHFRSSLDRF